MFFSEEKNQKTFILLAHQRRKQVADLAAAPGTKVFCFFSSEKKAFLTAFASDPSAPARTLSGPGTRTAAPPGFARRPATSRHGLP